MSPKNVSLKIRLLGGFLTISALVLAVSLIGITSFTSVSEVFEEIITYDYPRYTSLLSIRNTTNEIKNQTLVLTLGSSGSVVGTRSVDLQKNEILANVEKIQTEIGSYKQHIGEDETEGITKLNQISQVTGDVIDNAFLLISLREQQASISAIGEVETKLIANQSKLQTEIDDLIEKELTNIEREDEIADQTIAQSISHMYLISVMAVVVAIAGGFSLSLPILAKIRKLRKSAFEVARGNLDVSIGDTSTDELGQLSQSFDQMVQRLKGVSQEKEKSAAELQKKTEELSQRMDETERINRLMLGRELKMMELKRENESLKKKLEV